MIFKHSTYVLFMVHYTEHRNISNATFFKQQEILNCSKDLILCYILNTKINATKRYCLKQ